MGKPIVYCGQCGKSLPEDEFTRGRAQVIDHQPFCISCRPLVASPPAEKLPPSSSRRIAGPMKSTTRRAVVAPSVNSRAILVGAALFILVIVIIVVVMASGGKERPPEPAPMAAPSTPKPSIPPAPPPPVRPTTPAPLPTGGKSPADVEREMVAEREKAQAAQLDRFLAQIREIISKGWRLELRRGEMENMLASARKIAGKREAEVQRLKEEFERCASLVAHWPLDEREGRKVEDATGNDHDGELSGDPQRTPGRIGGALSFNGSSEGVVVSHAEGLSPQADVGEMTLAAWAKIPRFPVATGQGRTPIVAKGVQGAWEYALYLQSSGTFEFALWVPDGTNHLSMGGGKAAVDQWHHVAGVYERGKSARLYLDGKEVNRSNAFTGTPQGGAGPFTIGRRSDGQFLDGAVDDVRVYRRALNDDEIKALYEGK